MRKVIRRIKAWRDERFRKRIDRVYFQRDSDGNVFIYGRLVVLPDKVTGLADVFVYFPGLQEEGSEKNAQSYPKVPPL